MTPSELRYAALEELRIVASGDPVSAEDDALLRRKYEGLMGVLLRKRLADWSVEDDIPSYAQIALTQMLAYLAAPAFGISSGAMEQLRQAGGLDVPPNQGGPSNAERVLRSVLSKVTVTYTHRGTYY